MEPFITKSELINHLKELEIKAKTISYINVSCHETQVLLEMFDTLKQKKQVKRNPGSFIEEKETSFNTSFHFIDHRNATLYIVKRNSDKTLIIEKSFYAPEINKEDFFKMLPLKPQNYLIGFQEYRRNSYLYYANESIAFQVPLLCFLKQSDRNIEEIYIDLYLENDFGEIKIFEDEYAGFWNWYNHRYYFYKIKLSSFEIELINFSEYRYK